MSAPAAAPDRGDLAEQMLPVAARLACLVHGEGGPEDVKAVLDAVAPEHLHALIVVLAGMVDPKRPVSEALGWLDFDEHVQPIVPPWDDQTPISSLAEQDTEDGEDDEELVDEVAVQAYMAGRRVAVTDRERLAAVAAGAARGMTYGNFDRMHGLVSGTTKRFVERERRRAERAGLPFPQISVECRKRMLTESEVIDMRRRAAAGETDQQIALSYGLGRAAVQKIVTGERYAEFGGPLRRKRNLGQATASRELFNSSLPKAG